MRHGLAPARSLGTEISPKLSAIRIPIPPQTGAMANASFAPQPPANAPRSGLRRARVSIDFRRHGPVLAAVARSRPKTTAAPARSVLGEWLDAQSVDASSVGSLRTPGPATALQNDALFAKVTLRLPADRAARLAREARQAELSQGMYVSQLLDAQSPEDRLNASPRELFAALVRHSAELAALHSHLKTLVRALKQVSSPEFADLEVLAADLAEKVGQHLASAAPQLAALP